MRWTKQSIKWYIHAAEFGSFHATLAQTLSPYLRKSDRLLDIGCGLGYLSQALYPHVFSIRALDCNQQVLKKIRARAPNIRTQYYHWPDPLPEQADILLMSFFGHVLMHPERFIHRDERLILIKNQQRSVSAKTRECIGDVRQLFDDHHIDYDYQELTLCFDQPFQTKEEAFAFFAHYHINPKNAQLQPITHPVYTYLYKKQKRLGIIVSKGKEEK